jgi:RNA polymerase sigma factor (sigma-70 family)
VSNTPLGAVLRHIRKLGAAVPADERTDEQLLRAFADHREERAFTALVRRHGPLVLGVCRSALRHTQDAEDVFQATFLILARKAGSVRKGEALASFLHGVAHRLALHVRRSAARRRAHESRVKTMPRGTPCEDLSWREAEALLQEEVGRLPRKYRDVFVLCCLGDVRRADAARELGLREGTVSSRLAHARQLLRERLTRRGVSLAGACALLALSRSTAAALPARLMRATVESVLAEAAGGAVSACAASARVIALVEEVGRTMCLSKPKVALSFLLAGSLLTGLGALIHQARAQHSEAPPWTAAEPPRAAALVHLAPAQHSQAPSRTAAEPRAARQGDREGVVQPREGAARDEAAQDITVNGRVLNPEGKPFQGARLYWGHYGPADEVTVTERARSDADGRFQFSFPRSRLSKAHPDPRTGRTFGAFTFERYEPSAWPAIVDEVNPSFTPVGQVMAVAEGFGCDWARIDPEAGSAELTLRLVKDVPVSGRILDQEGRPVVGAKVHLVSVQGYPGEDPKDALAALPKAEWFPSGAKRWSGPLPGQARVVNIGEDGRFRMSGLGGNRFVTLRAEGPGIASGRIHVLTRAGDEVKGPQYTVYGANFRYLADTARPIRGVVTDKETGKPLAGAAVRVQPHGTFLVPGSGVWMLTARTDQEGRYEVLGCAKAPSYDVVVQPADSGPHFDVLLAATDTPGVGPLTVDVKVPRGIPARGKVRDGRTGKPIAGARVHYFALHPNAATRIFNDYTDWDAKAVTGADGSFAVPVLPGPGLLIAAAPDATMRAPSAAYVPGRLTDKEWDDFMAKHKMPPGEATKNKHKGIEWVWIDNKPNADNILVLNVFDSLALLHPDENDKELKQDLVMRPNEGKEKRKIPNLGNGKMPEMPKKDSEKPKDEPKKDLQP